MTIYKVLGLTAFLPQNISIRIFGRPARFIGISTILTKLRKVGTQHLLYIDIFVNKVFLVIKTRLDFFQREEIRKSKI